MSGQVSWKPVRVQRRPDKGYMPLSDGTYVDIFLGVGQDVPLLFRIYQVLPQILELWGDNLMTDVQAKKELAEVSGK